MARGKLVFGSCNGGSSLVRGVSERRDYCTEIYWDILVLWDILGYTGSTVGVIYAIILEMVPLLGTLLIRVP